MTRTREVAIPIDNKLMTCSAACPSSRLFCRSMIRKRLGRPCSYTLAEGRTMVRHDVAFGLNEVR